MSARSMEGAIAEVPLRGELRFGLELARLAADPGFIRPSRSTAPAPVLLVPGFMAGDGSLAILRGWLKRRGALTASAGIRLNVDCSERAMSGIELRLRDLVQRAGRPAVLIGHSRGGESARVVARRHPELVAGLVMLGSPVLDPLSVGPAVLRAVQQVARLGDLGVPGLFSTRCADGDCCEQFRADLLAPLPTGVEAVSIYSRSDGIVSWRACLDPSTRHVEVESSHCGMAVNRDVYRALATTLDGVETRWT